MTTEDRTEITIPAVTDAQRVQSADAAEITLRRIGGALRTIAGALDVYAADPELLDAYAADLHAWADRVRAAAGHLRIADSKN